MPRITNLFKEKMYAFGRHPEVYESEKELIEEIFIQEWLEVPEKIEFIDANINNDLFLVKNKDGRFYFKMSLDSDKNSLEKEFNIIHSNIQHFITPFPVANSLALNMKDIEYSILGEIPAPNLSDFGIANFLKDLNPANEFFKKLSLFRPPQKLNGFNDYCSHYLNFDIFKIPDIEVFWIDKHAEIKKLVQEQVIYLQKLLREKLKNFTMPQVHVCHGNLNSSTLLALGDNIHAINWEDAYYGDLYFELCNLKYELFFNHTVEKEIIDSFAEQSSYKISNQKMQDYASFTKYFQLLKIMVDYLTETYVLKASRKNKIINCAIKLSKNYDTFYQLPDFDKKLKPIAEFFTESVI